MVSDSKFQGLPVWSCFPGSVAERAGVRAGDVLLFANGMRVDSMDAYLDARRLDARRLELTVQRGNRVLDFSLDLTLEPKPAAAATAPAPVTTGTRSVLKH